MLITFSILTGFIILVWSADIFVKGAAAIAQNLGVSAGLIGLTIVSVGTSAPEILVSISAAFAGAGGLAIGNAVGSNIANIGLVLGVTICFFSIKVEKTYLDLEIPILVGVTILATILISDKQLSKIDATIMIAALPLVLYFIIKKRLADFSTAPKGFEEDLVTFSNVKATFLFSTGLVLLIISSKLLVWGAKEAALALGVSELVVGLTIVAVGTSLPELAASITSALKSHADLAFGNVIGSNIFNLLAVMPIPSLIQTMDLDKEFLYRDFLTMGILTLMLSGLIYFTNAVKKARGNDAFLGRKIGIACCASYISYYFWLYTSM